jgi:hypothetical protein
MKKECDRKAGIADDFIWQSANKQTINQSCLSDWSVLAKQKPSRDRSTQLRCSQTNSIITKTIRINADHSSHGGPDAVSEVTSQVNRRIQ